MNNSLIKVWRIIAVLVKLKTGKKRAHVVRKMIQAASLNKEINKISFCKLKIPLKKETAVKKVQGKATDLMI